MEDENIKHNFIKTIIIEDIEKGKNNGAVITRFPPEPNGFLHMGHSKSICLNFGIGKEFNGRCNLRFDDTNPAKEDQKYIDAIIEDVHWLGFDWGDTIHYASDYFHELYDFAVELIKKDKAYVCALSAEKMREYRRGVVLDYLALGLDPEKVTFFYQSDVPEHAELQWILSTVTTHGLLERAHAWKDAKGCRFTDVFVGVISEMNTPAFRAFFYEGHFKRILSLLGQYL